VVTVALQDLLAIGQGPDSDQIVPAARSQALTVGTEADAPDALGALDRQHGLAGRGIPDVDGAVQVPGSEFQSVRAEGHARHGTDRFLGLLRALLVLGRRALVFLGVLG